MSTTTTTVSSAFIWRRVHSLMGFWIAIYLIEHLLVNSQAALWIGDDGIGFIKLVNLIQSIPYLQVVETLLIGVPLGIHAVWGVKRALTAKSNSRKTDGSSPSLKEYGRNRAFSWQRITSWILLFGIIGHVVQMRFIEKPKEAEVEGKKGYFTKISVDNGLYTLAPRLGVVLYNQDEIKALSTDSYFIEEPVLEGEPTQEALLQLEQKNLEVENWLETLSSYRLDEDQIVAESPSHGTALLLMVRDTFKSPIMAVIYSIFVLAAAFHAFNGFWTFLITWGVILSYRSQKAMIPVSVIGILFLSFLGLVSIWGSYWINLRN